MEPIDKRAEDAENVGDLETAYELWKQLAPASSDEYVLTRYGRVAQKLQKWEEAERAFARAFRMAPTSSLVMEIMGSLWADRTDKTDAESFQTAKQWFLKALELGRHARLLTQLACVDAALDNEEGARGWLEEAIQLDPDYEEALYNLAVLEEDSNPEKAIDQLERAIRIDADYAEAHQVLGRLYQKAGDLIRAHYHFRRCLEIDPADYWSNLYLANLLAVQGRNDEAENTYRLATSLCPEISDGAELFANFLDNIGKSEEAASVRAKLGRPG